MNETNGLAVYKGGLPDTPQELVKFALVAQEKLASVRAEIRAIKKLALAQEVEQQKMDEARMISEALLDAQTLIGDMTRSIPTAPGKRTDIKNIGGTNFENTQPDSVQESVDFKKCSASPFKKPLNEPRCSRSPRLQKTKRQVTEELGLTQDQVKQFETLSKNKDLVELAKAQARENDDIPTRSQVLSLAQARQKKFDRDMAQIDADEKTANRFHKALCEITNLPQDAKTIRSFIRGTYGIETQLDRIDEAIEALSSLKTKTLRERRAMQDGKKYAP